MAQQQGGSIHGQGSQGGGPAGCAGESGPHPAHYCLPLGPGAGNTQLCMRGR